MNTATLKSTQPDPSHGMGSDPLGIGPLNGHATGIVMKELVRRAMRIIARERLVFQANEKAGYDGRMDDVFTSADTKAQAIILKSLRECFPCCGVIAEEESLKIAPFAGCNAYFTIDPLDGTKAYVRRQSHGVGTMVSLVIDGEIAAAYIGNPNTNEIFGYRPGSAVAHRITELESSEHLPSKPEQRLKDSYALLRDPLRRYESRQAREFAENRVANYNSDGGSIGIWAARLWTQEVAALLLPPGKETPWDSTPVDGITRKLGYVYLRPEIGSGLVSRGIKRWQAYVPAIHRSVAERPHDTLIVHEKHLPEMADIVVQ